MTKAQARRNSPVSGSMSEPAIDPDHDFRSRRLQGADKAAYRGVAAGVAALYQTLMDGRHLDTLLPQPNYQLPVGLHRGSVLRRQGRVHRLFQQFVQLAQGRQRTFQQALSRRPGAVARHRLAVHTCHLCHSPVALTVLDVSQQFSNVHGLLPFAGHPFLSFQSRFERRSMPQVVEFDQSLCGPPWPTVSGMTGPVWPNIHGPAWMNIAGPIWPNIYGPAWMNTMDHYSPAIDTRLPGPGGGKPRPYVRCVVAL